MACAADVCCDVSLFRSDVRVGLHSVILQVERWFYTETVLIREPHKIHRSIVVLLQQWRQREFKFGGTSLVSRLSVCLTEANRWRFIAE